MNNIASAVQAAIETGLEKYQLPSSDSAVTLLLMIAAHESGGFTYCKQLNGPALGLFQMEPDTFDFVMGYIARTGKFTTLQNTQCENMVTYADFAAAIARVYFWTFPEALPNADDLMGLAEYAKKYWNTSEGKATAEKYYNDYNRYVLGQ